MVDRSTLVRHALLEPLHLVGFILMLGLVMMMPAPPLLELGMLVLAEAVYLFSAVGSPAYARRVSLKAGMAAVEEREQALEQRALELRRDDRKRFNELSRVYQDVKKRLEETGQSVDTPIGIDVRRLQELREAALEFCLTSQRFREHLTKTDPQVLQQELQGPPPSDEAARTARGIKQQRLEGLLQMQQQLGSLEHQLGVIEQTFRLIKEQLSTLKAQAIAPLGQEVGKLSTEVEATRRTLQEMAAFEKSLG